MQTRLIRFARLLAACAAVWSASCAMPTAGPAQVVRGPIPTRILQPAGLIFPGPRPRRAVVVPEGRLFTRADVSYASIFEVERVPFESAEFDGEIARFGLDLRYGINPHIEVGIEPTFLFASSGFLDRIVDEFHAVTGFVGGGRESFARDQYSMRLGRNGVTAYEFEEDDVQLADLPVTFTASLRAEDEAGPSLAARAVIELPTGDEAAGAGSGGVDFAGGLLLERSSRRWTFFGSLDGVVADTPSGYQAAGIDVRKLLLVGGGVEYRWSDRLSLLGQATLQTPLTRSLSTEEINREILDLGFGFAYDIRPGTALTLSVHEDAIAASGPDVTVYFGLTFRP